MRNGAAYFLRRLRIARAVMPRIMPAIIDSHGNPGIGGNANGVETELDCEVLAAVVVVDELVTVKVATGVLAAVAVEALVELEVVTLVDVLPAEVLVELTVVVLVLEAVVVAGGV